MKGMRDVDGRENPVWQGSWRCLSVVILYFLVSISMLSTDAKGTPENKTQILTPTHVVKLAAAGSSAAWSPDSKKILVDLPLLSINSDPGQSQLVDVETGTVSTPTGIFKNGLDHFFWSPNGKYIVGAGVPKLLSYPEFEVLGKVDVKERPCLFESKHRAAAFTSDSSGVWLACRSNLNMWTPTGAKFLAAVKYSVPDFRLVDKFYAPHPTGGSKYFESYSELLLQDGKVVLNSCIVTENQSSGEKQKYQDGIYFGSFAVEQVKPLYPAFRANAHSVSGTGNNALAFLEHSDQVIFAIGDFDLTIGARGVELDVTQKALMLVHPSTKKTVAKYDILSKLKMTGIGSLLLSKNKNFLFTKLTRQRSGTKEREGAVGIWNTKALEFIQKVEAKPFSWLELSPDGSHLAGLYRNQIYLFSVNDKLSSN